MATDHDAAEFRESQILEHLAESGQWERVLSTGHQILGSDPENSRAHYLSAIAALELEDKKTAEMHVESLIRLEPEIASARYLQAICFQKRNRDLLAKNALEEALRLDPHDSQIWIAFAWNCVNRGDFRTAREAAIQARALQPESIQIEQIEAAIGGMSDAADRLTAWEQIESLEHSLRLDPEDDQTMSLIASLYLDELGRGREAAEWLRQALAIDPTNREYQNSFARALRRQDPVLRFLNWPIHLTQHTFRLAEHFFAHRPLWVCAGALLLLPLLIALMTALAIWCVFLFVPGKVYEYLTLSEIRKTIAGGADLSGIHRLPNWARLIVALVISLSFMGGTLWIFTAAVARPYLETSLGIATLLAAVLGIYFSARKDQAD